jgi:hypothetical protein
VDRSSVLLRDIRVGSERFEEANEKELSSFLGRNAALKFGGFRYET